MNNFTRYFAQKAVLAGTDEGKGLEELLRETQKWTAEKMIESGIAPERKQRMLRSNEVIDQVLEKRDGGYLLDPERRAALLYNVAFDARPTSEASLGTVPKSAVAAEALESSGRHLGKYLLSVIRMCNPAEIVIFGGGANRFKQTHYSGELKSLPGDLEDSDALRSYDEALVNSWRDNPFARGMLSELVLDSPDTWKSIAQTRIVVPELEGRNIAAEGAMGHAVTVFCKSRKGQTDK